MAPPATSTFLDAGDMRRLVRHEGLPAFTAAVAARIEREFLRWEDFDKTPRVASHSARGVIELMPVSDGRRYTFKYVNGQPDNPRTGLQTVTAQGIGVDPTQLVAANTSGGAVAKLVSPQSIAIAAGAVGLTGREGEILRAVIGWSLAMLGVVCVWVMLLSLVVPPTA